MIVFPPIYSYTKFDQLLALVVAYLGELLATIQAYCFTQPNFGFFEVLLQFKAKVLLQL